jgi:hypothetical protein
MDLKGIKIRICEDFLKSVIRFLNHRIRNSLFPFNNRHPLKPCINLHKEEYVND